MLQMFLNDIYTLSDSSTGRAEPPVPQIYSICKSQMCTKCNIFCLKFNYLSPNLFLDLWIDREVEHRPLHDGSCGVCAGNKQVHHGAHQLGAAFGPLEGAGNV